MIKLISKNNPNILAFKIQEELETEDVEWLVHRVVKKEDATDRDVLLYIEFDRFGELTFSRMWDHFKMLLEHFLTLMMKVTKIAVISSNQKLKDKLSIEFKLIPTIDYQSFNEKETAKACDWLEQKSL